MDNSMNDKQISDDNKSETQESTYETETENENETENETDEEHDQESKEEMYDVHIDLEYTAMSQFVDQIRSITTQFTRVVSRLALNSVLLYGTCSYYINVFLGKLYESHPTIAIIMDNIKYAKDCGYAYTKNMKIEPLNNNWTSISYINYGSNPNTIPQYKELLINLNDGWYTVNNVNTINNILLFEYSRKFDQEMEDPLFITKFESLGTFKYCVSKQRPLQIEFSEIIPSNVKFLSIVYTHPDMKTQIPLELSKHWYVVKNELFCPEFVFRQLSYQPEPFVFDLRYKLQLMDNNVNSFELTVTDYIELEENEYSIKKVVN